MVVETLNHIVDLWEMSDDEDHQGLVCNLFSYVIYDLETRRIVDFRLKPWADQFVMVRRALYLDEQKNAQTTQEFKRPLAHTGSEDKGRLTFLPEVIWAIITSYYQDRPWQRFLREKRTRNQYIRALFNDNVSLGQLARQFGISEQRIYQIVSN